MGMVCFSPTYFILVFYIGVRKMRNKGFVELLQHYRFAVPYLRLGLIILFSCQVLLYLVVDPATLSNPVFAFQEVSFILTMLFSLFLGFDTVSLFARTNSVQNDEELKRLRLEVARWQKYTGVSTVQELFELLPAQAVKSKKKKDVPITSLKDFLIQRTAELDELKKRLHEGMRMRADFVSSFSEDIYFRRLSTFEDTQLFEFLATTLSELRSFYELALEISKGHKVEDLRDAVQKIKEQFRSEHALALEARNQEINLGKEKCKDAGLQITACTIDDLFSEVIMLWQELKAKEEHSAMSLGNERKKFEKLSTVFHRLRKIVSNKRVLLSQNKVTIAALEQSLAASRDFAAKNKTDLENTLRDLRKDLEAAKTKIKSLETKKEDQLPQRSSRDIAHISLLTKKSEELVSELSNLKSILSEKDTCIDRLRKKIQEQSDDALRKLREAEERHANLLAECKNRQPDFENEIQALRRQLESCNAERIQLKDYNQTLSEHATQNSFALARSENAARKNAEESEQKILHFSRDLKAAQEELESLKQQIRLLDEKRISAEAVASTLRNEVSLCIDFLTQLSKDEGQLFVFLDIYAQVADYFKAAMRIIIKYHSNKELSDADQEQVTLLRSLGDISESAYQLSGSLLDSLTEFIAQRRAACK